jgi:hypothetical protein
MAAEKKRLEDELTKEKRKDKEATAQFNALAEIKNYSTGRIVVGAPRSKGLALLVRHPIGGDMWMG